MIRRAPRQQLPGEASLHPLVLPGRLSRITSSSNPRFQSFPSSWPDHPLNQLALDGNPSFPRRTCNAILDQQSAKLSSLILDFDCAPRPRCYILGVHRPCRLDCHMISIFATPCYSTTLDASLAGPQNSTPSRLPSTSKHNDQDDRLRFSTHQLVCLAQRIEHHPAGIPVHH